MMDGAPAGDGRSAGHERGTSGAGPDSRFAGLGTLPLLRRVLENLGAMMHGESALLKAELRETGRSYATAAVASVVAVIAVGAFVNFLGLAAVAGLLAADLPLWAAALICAGALVLIAAGAAIYALGAVRSADPVPRRTIDNIRRDFRAMSDALRREGD